MLNSNPASNLKRSKKPKPLFGLFRKNKPDPIAASSQELGSGISPLNSMISPTYIHDPYAPPRILPKPSTSETRKQPKQQRRQRSKSVGRDPSTVMMEERELALNKLCKREPPSSLVDSLPLLSPTYAPPVPPIPLKHKPNNSSSIRKFNSAHDLRKAARLQQESIQQQVPLPAQRKPELSRSKSFSASTRKLQSSRSHQNLVKSPTTPTMQRHVIRKPTLPPPPPPLPTTATRSNANDDDDDDDVPLGYLQSPISKPSSLLSDREEDDDKDLVPIAVLDVKPTEEFQTAADKYKEKVKERLNIHEDKGATLDDDDDDDIPISLALMSPKWKKKEIKKLF